MRPAFVILIWLVLAGIFGFFWVVSLVVFLIGRWKKKRWLKWMGLVPLTGLTIIALLAGTFFAIGITRAITPKYVFTDYLGEKPGGDVGNIRSKVWSFADSTTVHLQFQSSPETFHRLLPKELKRAAFQEYEYYFHVEDEWPDWWRPINGFNSEVYFINTSRNGKRRASETILMTYDSRTKIVQYFYLGID
jgi:hypothetical protein